MPKITIEINNELRNRKELTGLTWRALINCGIRWMNETREDNHRINTIENEVTNLKWKIRRA